MPSAEMALPSNTWRSLYICSTPRSFEVSSEHDSLLRYEIPLRKSLAIGGGRVLTWPVAPTSTKRRET